MGPKHRGHHKERAPAIPSLLGRPNSFSIDPTIPKLFYDSFITSVLTSSFICWFYNMNAKELIPQDCEF